MKTKQALEGYLMINHKDSPGLSDELVMAQGMPPGAGRGLFESAIVTCSHCQTVVILNPLRTRERAWCPGCDRYVCDVCNLSRIKTGICKPFTQIADEIVENEIKKTLVKEI